MGTLLLSSLSPALRIGECQSPWITPIIGSILLIALSSIRLAVALLHNVLVCTEPVPHEVEVEEQQVSQEGEGKQGKTDGQSGQRWDDGSGCSDWSNGKEDEPHLRLVPLLEVLVCPQLVGIEEELDEDIGGTSEH